MQLPICETRLLTQLISTAVCDMLDRFYAWYIQLLEDCMNTQFISGSLAITIRVYMGFESLPFMYHMLVPSKTDSFSIFDIGNRQDRTHLISNLNWPFNVQNL